MTLFVEQRYPDDVPQLHALIIGVGHYPYTDVSSGGKPLPLLGNLHSPAPSARTLARWLRDQQGWLSEVALGTIDLLVSDHPDAPPTPPDTPPTFDNIVAAFDAWLGRCEKHRDNIALFSFCGHGLQKDATLLLPQDFGRFKRSPWPHAIDFDKTYRNMATCPAKTQYYIIDACRMWNEGIINDLSASGAALGRGDIRSLKPRTAPKLYAASQGHPGFGDVRGEPSRLTKALIECLDQGKAAEKLNGLWHISTDDLGSAVKTLIDIDNRRRPERDWQLVDPNGGESGAGPRRLVTLPGDRHPVVEVEFVCDPDEATEHAEFYHQGVAPSLPPKRAGCRGPWATSVLAGTYHCGADMAAHPAFASRLLMDEPIRPPWRPVSVPVTPRGPGAGSRA
jgi:hypothetical protein